MSFKNRYDILLNLVHTYKPKTICEIGVNKGDRSIELCKTALLYQENISFVGYDLFEDITKEINEKELNIKPNYPVSLVLKQMREQLPNDKVNIDLIKGNTWDTLKEDQIFDFVWLDGGHSIETIEHDYNKIKNSKIIVLDDYYEPDENKQMMNIEKFGCNQLVTKIPNAKILRGFTQDRVSGGGFVRIVLIDNITL